VNSHKNAKLTPTGRALLVRRVVQEHQPVRQVAQALGVCPKTVYRWVRRWQLHGLTGLVDRSSRPRHSPTRLRAAVVRRIVALRQRRWTSLRIAAWLRLRPSTVVRTLQRLGLNRLRALVPPGPVVRYQREQPGELLHVDTKRLGRIGRVGHRIHGDRTTRVRGIGWETVHVAIDDATRVAYVEVLADEQTPTVVGFLERARAWYAARGVTVTGLMTDNGSAYRSHAVRTCLAGHGIRHLRTRPYTPRTNGKAERLIQTLLREWAYERPYRSSAARAAALPDWQRYYNTQRPHTALDFKAPRQRLAELRVDNVHTNNN
jgi:transposase InsO family protein